MNVQDLRAWMFARQGLDGSLSGATPEVTLRRAGWARSVGGANPYLTLFSRAGTSREDADAAVERLEIHELPSARGCTYVVPSADFGVALAVARGFGSNPEMARARSLGVTEDEIERLEQGVLRVLPSGPKDPREMRPDLGDLVRSLGDEGKKKGLTSTLPVALGRLQVQGRIRRVPIDGRLDNERYRYALWNPAPPWQGSPEEAFVELARLYWAWIGIASTAHFQWFSGLGVGKAKAAMDALGLVPIGDDLLAKPEDADSINSFRSPKDPQYALVSGLDGIFLHRRDAITFLDDDAPVEKGGLQDLENNAILDRGRIVGLWEYDPERQEIVWKALMNPDAEFRNAIARTETFIREQLGDARSYSLDSPKSRKPRLDALMEMAAK